MRRRVSSRVAWEFPGNHGELVLHPLFHPENAAQSIREMERWTSSVAIMSHTTGYTPRRLAIAGRHDLAMYNAACTDVGHSQPQLLYGIAGLASRMVSTIEDASRSPGYSLLQRLWRRVPLDSSIGMLQVSVVFRRRWQGTDHITGHERGLGIGMRVEFRDSCVTSSGIVAEDFRILGGDPEVLEELLHKSVNA